MITDIPFDIIDESHLVALLQTQERESKHLEYKVDLPVSTNSAHKEFLFDVSSFANANGGDILYGIGAADGLPNNVPGIAKPSIDAEILRLENLLRAGIAPRIPGVRMRAIDLANGNCVLYVRVPKTWAGPHMVVLQATNKFYSRNSAGKYLLDIDELRAAFSLGEQFGEKIRAFRLDRANMILNRQLSVSLSDSAKCVLHVLPVVSFRTGFRVDLREALRTATNDMIPMSASNWDRYFNYDGLLTYSDPSGSGDYTYFQLFRNGCVEAVESEFRNINQNKILQSFVRKDELVECGNRVLRLLTKLGVEPPFVAALSLLGVRGYQVWLHLHKPLHAHPIERANLFLEEIVIEESTADLADSLKPAFDQIWNACGFAESS